jgi:hypothetical protein
MKILIIFLFIKLISTFNIECSFFIEPWYPEYLYTCAPITVDFSANSTHATSYNGTHKDGKSASDVRMVHFVPSFNFFPTFPRGFLKIFPNLDALKFAGRQWNSLKGDELEEYPNLVYFTVRQASLVRIPGNLFALNPKMRHIEFYDNKIEHVGEGLLDHLKNLSRVDFENNVCINKAATSPSQYEDLIERLRVQCPENKTDSTTVALSTTTTTENSSNGSTQSPSRPDRCFDDFIENFICEINDKAKDLIPRTEKLWARVRALQDIQNQFIRLTKNFANLEKKVETLES